MHIYMRARTHTQTHTYIEVNNEVKSDNIEKKLITS